MTRAGRLLELLAYLRRHRRAVTGPAIAAAMGVSLRTVYRDIATLQGQGARIEGEAGVGYVLREGFVLPPLMFSEEETEALVLGARWVMERGDAALGEAAGAALAKIIAVLPEERREAADATPLLVGPGGRAEAREVVLREAIRRERRTEVDYRDKAGAATSRTIWPIALAYFEAARVVVAWCELRGDFRHFRLDRMEGVRVLEGRYPRRRAVLLADWRLAEGVRD